MQFALNIRSVRLILHITACATLITANSGIRAQVKSVPATPKQSADGQYKVGDKIKASSSVPSTAVSTATKTITWDDLMPKDWDPNAAMKNLNFGLMGDGDPRAMKALEDLRKAWANAPVVSGIKGQSVRIPGFIVPLDADKKNISEFLLVPYFGACIHTPPPPSNQVIHVTPKVAVSVDLNMMPVWISGTIDVARFDSALGSAGYQFTATSVTKYEIDKNAASKVGSK